MRSFICNRLAKYLVIKNLHETDNLKIVSIVLLGGQYTDDAETCHLAWEEGSDNGERYRINDPFDISV